MKWVGGATGFDNNRFLITLKLSYKRLYPTKSVKYLGVKINAN